MFTSNSFNVCPHCGKANSLSARYCSSCGKQLAVPEEAVVCPKCHKTNSPLASYCGACGAPLRTASQTKICPRCGKQVDVSQNVCSCGYSFSAAGFVRPDSGAVPAPAAAVADAGAATPKGKNPANKGGRIIAAVALVFLLLFAYLLMVPQSSLRPDAITDIDKGVLSGDTDGYPKYGYDVLREWVVTVTGVIKGELDSASTVGELITRDIGGFAAMVFIAVTAVSMAIHLLVCVERIITGKRSKNVNVFFIVMAVFSTFWLALVSVATFVDFSGLPEVVGKIVSYVKPVDGIGFAIYAIPLYYWFFFFYSIGARAKRIKENVAA